ncbi:wax ester/triacylglycerol synthase domain-containing protein [Nocardia sp. NPDC127526]|uniref:wax ester/triacylglycerol synthase domain-containing protein n=1 Tax=Nocardia sp. NPDC127526 TaxID=3345393 RepID=UPI003631C77A
MRSTIVSVLVLDRSPDWNRLVRMIDRGTRAVPRFRHRLTAVPFGLAPPRWVPDREFDVRWHLRRIALPPPGEFAAVLEFARVEAMTAFDPARPLWQFTLLEGLAQGRTALVFKVHHSLTDGIGGIRIAGEMLDLVRAGTAREPVPEPEADGAGVLGDIVSWNSALAVDLMRGGVAAVLPVLGRVATDPARAVRDGLALGGSLLRLVRPITRTLSPLMTGRGLGRAMAVLEVPLDDLRTGAHRAGCTTNDAFLAAVLLGIRAYHDRHGAHLPGLRVAMPISLRKDGDPLGGNRITLARFEVPLGDTGPVALERELDAIVRTWRQEPAVPLSNAVAAAFNRLPTGLLTDMFKHVDLVASDVPGSPVPLYVAGAEIERIYAFGPTTGTSLNVTLVSHAGMCCVGINADTSAVPDLPNLTDCIAAGFRTIVRLGDTEPDAAPDRPRVHPARRADRRIPSGER